MAILPQINNSMSNEIKYTEVKLPSKTYKLNDDIISTTVELTEPTTYEDDNDIILTSKLGSNKLMIKEIKGKTEQASYTGKNQLINLYGRGTGNLTFNINKNHLTTNLVFSGILNVNVSNGAIYFKLNSGDLTASSRITATANQRFVVKLTLTSEELQQIQSSTYCRIQIYKSSAFSSETTYEEMQLENGIEFTGYEPYVRSE